MRILVVGEGPTDCGRYKDNQWVDGPVQIYLRRLLPSADVMLMQINRKIIPRQSTRAVKDIRILSNRSSTV